MNQLDCWRGVAMLWCEKVDWSRWMMGESCGKRWARRGSGRRMNKFIFVKSFKQRQNLMFEKEVVIDGKGHLQGRLASYIAKELQLGQRIVVVRCELINKSGSLFRNRVTFQEYLNRRLSFNPRRAWKHFRFPSRIFWKTVRGMLAYKTKRGAAALQRLKVFEGVPAPYDTRKRMVVPDALKVVRLKSHRPFCTLGDLAASVGWNHQQTITRLEEKRKTRGTTYYKRKLAKENVKRKAMGMKEIKTLSDQLAQYGY